LDPQNQKKEKEEMNFPDNDLITKSTWLMPDKRKKKEAL
jgi:hypothetical protein